MATHVEVQPYQSKVHKWVIPKEPFTALVQDKSLVYELGVTPQIPEEPQWCIFMATVIKQTLNKTYGSKIVDCKVTYGYKINAIGRLLTPEFLYELLVLSYQEFKKIYDKDSEGTQAAKYIVDKPELKDYKSNLQAVIIGQGISKQ